MSVNGRKKPLRTTGQLRALLAMFCVLGIIVSLFSMPVPQAVAAPATTSPQSELMVDNGGGKKPCQRGTSGRTGSACSIGVFAGLEATDSALIQPSLSKAGINPGVFSAQAAQCRGASHFRPPRIDA